MAPMENLPPGYHYSMDHHHNQFQPPEWNAQHPPPPPPSYHYYDHHQPWEAHHHHLHPPVVTNSGYEMNHYEQNPFPEPPRPGSPLDTYKGQQQQQQPAEHKQPLGQTQVNLPSSEVTSTPGPSTSQPPLLPSFGALKSPTTRVFESMLTAADTIATPAPKRNSAGKNGKKKATKKQKVAHAKAAASKEEGKDTSELPLSLTLDETENPFALIERDAVLYKKVVLCMALQRQPKETKDDGETPDPVIKEGFYWKDYPPCETVLYESMSDYYELSKQSRQSKQQQAFNNELVRKIRATAAQYGYTFDDNYFTDKRLRDRIRCFFKTHLQNGKKRLVTMQKHPETLENQQALHKLIQQAKARIAQENAEVSQEEKEQQQEQNEQEMVERVIQNHESEEPEQYHHHDITAHEELQHETRTHHSHDILMLPAMDESLYAPEFTFSDEHDSLLPPADADDYEIDGKKRRRSSLSSI